MSTPFAARHLVADEERWRTLQGPAAASGVDNSKQWRLRFLGTALIAGSLATFAVLRWVS